MAASAGIALRKRYDYVVVGTGPGGGTVARELAREGRSCLIVERGPRLRKTGLLNVGATAFWDGGKKPLRSDGDIWFGRVQVLGGGSYVAMGNAAAPPQRILDEWGVNLSDEVEWARDALRVNFMPEEFMGPATRRLNEAATSLGWSVKPTPKCVDFSLCSRCSLCMFGCPTGAKWTTVEFVDKAVDHGADLLLQTVVRRVLHENGRVSGVEMLRDGRVVSVNADAVVLSAGALSTPVILQNSGVQAGKGLAGDVFQTTYGRHPDVGMKGEIIMATYLESAFDELELFPAPYMYVPFLVQRDIDGGLPETLSRLQQGKMLLRSTRVDTNHMVGMMTKIRDERTGEVCADGTIRKGVTERDRAKLAEAHAINKEILIAAGVKPDSVFTGVYESGHPCCTAAIGEVVDFNQETSIRGLYVSDASVFPSPLGMPPILTIVALSRRLATHLL